MINQPQLIAYIDRLTGGTFADLLPLLDGPFKNAFAGVSLGSLKPKSAAAKVYAVSSFVVTVLSAPAGASFTERTFTVIVFGL